MVHRSIQVPMTAEVKRSDPPTEADFHQAISMRSGRWYSACLKITRDPNLAADAVQDGLLSAWHKRHQFGHGARLDTWIHRIAVNAALQLVRKRGKLPRQAISVRYELEYGFDHLEVHADAIEANGRYLIVDDVIATGGTAAAVADLVEQRQGTVAACAFVIELEFLGGRRKLEGHDIVSLITY